MINFENTLNATDFNMLFDLHKACTKEQDRKIQKIMIDYFEKRPDEVYQIAQLLMARVHFMEVP